MKRKVEFIGKINGLKTYVVKNSFENKINSNLMFDYWRCGYVEFKLPKGLLYTYYSKIIVQNPKVQH